LSIEFQCLRQLGESGPQVHFTFSFTLQKVNLRLFTTRIREKFQVFQSKIDRVKSISGTAALRDIDPQGLLWNSGTNHWKLAQSELVIDFLFFSEQGLQY
jgi:hypothetical protein